MKLGSLANPAMVIGTVALLVALAAGLVIAKEALASQAPTPSVFERNPANDFDMLDAAGNNRPTGVWSDGTTMWVADGYHNATSGDNKIYAYDMVTRVRVPTKDFDTLSAAGNVYATGIWSDGTTMWVADNVDGYGEKIYAYNMVTKARVPAKDFNTLEAAGNDHPRGIWSDGATMWVVDDVDDRVYAYDMTTKARAPAKDFDTLADVGNYNAHGIWSDGTTMWVSDSFRYNCSGFPWPWTITRNCFAGKIYAYDMATKARVAAREFDTLSAAGNGWPTGIWSDGAVMWVADGTDDKIYVYNMPQGSGFPGTATVSDFARNPANDFTLEVGFAGPSGIWSDRVTMWVADESDAKIYAYDMATRARLPDKDFNTLEDAGNDNPSDIWSDGTTMWVADYSDDKIYAYNLSTRARDSSKDFNTLDSAENENPHGIWSDRETMWVADYWDDKIYAYNMSTMARDSSNDFDTLDSAGNDNPQGIWSDGTTMWVADSLDDKIYAYNVSTKARDSSKDFDTLDSAGNDSPQGIWSDGTTMWVADESDARTYAYDMATKAPVAGREFDTLENESPLGIWSDRETMWVADESDAKIYAYDMETKARVAAKEFDTLEDAGNDNPSGIWSDRETMWVADESDAKIYAYNMGTKARVAAKEFDTLEDAGNDNPSGIWSDGITMWVADYGDTKIYAYAMGTKARVAAREFDTLAATGNFAPQDLWSDGITMWVGNTGVSAKIYSYDAAAKTRVPAWEFDTLSSAGNHSPTGIWSDEMTMWVVDDGGERIYAYNVPQASRVPVRQTRPGAPTGLIAAGNGQTQIDLSWSTPAFTGGAPITGYRVEVSADGSAWSDLEADTGTTSTSYSHAGLMSGSTRHYRISAINSAGTSTASNVATATTESLEQPTADICATGDAVSDADNNPGLVSDCEALLAARDTLRGTRTLNWSASTPITSWDGVTLAGVPQRVTRLDLDGSADLNGDRLTGRIPAELGGLTSLGSLALGNNQLTGPIPAELGGLSNLEELFLGDNRLTGTIPSELGSLSNLTYLDLFRNQLTGAVPSELSSLSNLEGLHLSDNQLTGAIPARLGGLSNLEGLFLDGNQLTEAIPSELGDLSNLVDLFLAGNQLTGTIPSELAALSNLEQLFLADNQLSGRIPAELDNLSNLENLDLSGNSSLSGPLPGSFTSLTSLIFLSLSGTGLCAPTDAAFQAWLGGIANSPGVVNCAADSVVARYDANNNRMIERGEVIAAIRDYFDSGAGITRADVIRLIRLYFDAPSTPHNRPGAPEGLTAAGDGQTRMDLSWSAPPSDGGAAITGYRIEVSEDLTSWNDLESDTGSTATSYSHTGLTAGTTRHYRVSAINSAGTGPPSNLAAARTSTTGTDRAALVALYNATDGPNWANDSNWLTDEPLGAWHGVSTDASGRVTRLELHENGLSGSIPSEMGNLTSLKALILWGNSITEISGLSEVVSLRVLSLGYSNIPDISPVAGLTNLTDLSFSDMDIPDLSVLSGISNLERLRLIATNTTDLSPLSGLTNLTSLTLSHNSVTDISPLAELTNLTYLNSWENQIENISALSGLTNLTEVGLGLNNVTDLSALSGLTKLETLWLNDNNVTDISALAGLTNLTELGLGTNSITDTSALAELTSLMELDLASNNIADIAPLAGLTNLRNLDLRGNVLNDSSIAEHVPALESNGTAVLFDMRLTKGDFDIELVLLDDFTDSQKRVIEYTALRWMAVIIEDVPEYEFTEVWPGQCGGQSFEIPSGERIDDLRIYVATGGQSPGIHGTGGIYVMREESHLPVVGCMTFDLSHANLLVTGLHEIGHVLGFASEVWNELGFYQNPPNGDGHFNGPLATAAFDDAGGRDYNGAKVPLQQGSSHWRLSVLEGELMSPSGGGTLSAITVQSMADLGYGVDATQADPYTLPGAIAGE